MSPETQILLSGALTFGVPLAFAVRELVLLRRDRGAGGGAGPAKAPAAPPPAPRPAASLPDCLIPRPAPRPAERARELEPA
jgi:hypothetical protein